MTNIPIFLSADNNYAPFVATTIASICDNTKSFCEFYVLDGGITQKNKEKICDLKHKFDNFSVEFLNIDVENRFLNFGVNTNFSKKTMFTRFLIPELKPEINKAIYSDVDVIVTGDIAEMYDEDLEGYALGAVSEDFFEKIITKKHLRDLELDKNHKYFASGNLLLNCELWRKNRIWEKLTSISEKYSDKILYPDQDILNKCFENNYKRLGVKYCFVDPCYEFCSDKNFIIRHYTGLKKPWKISPDLDLDFLPDTKLFWKYAILTSFYEELYHTTEINNLIEARPLKVVTKINNAKLLQCDKIN